MCSENVGNMKNTIAYLIKHNVFIQKCYVFIFSKLFSLIGKFVEIDDRLVLFVSYGGSSFNDSPKVIYDAMKNNPKWNDFKFVWAFEKPEKFVVEKGKKIKIDTLKYFFVALKAKIWITNVNIERGLHFKNKKTIYLNTWHGTGPKKGGNGVKGRSDYDFSYVDILCVDGSYVANAMKTYFNAKLENMLWCGRPREDALIFQKNEFNSNVIKKKLGIKCDKRIILYMPTWREYKIRALDVGAWKKELGDEYILLIRNHHFVTEKMYYEYADFVIDASNYANVNELYWISDILISDYSSAFFDFGLLGKPMFCYAYDYDEYNNSNGLLMNLKEVFPRGIITSEQELIYKIKHTDYNKYSLECNDFCAQYVSHKANATETCLKRLNTLLNN